MNIKEKIVDTFPKSLGVRITVIAVPAVVILLIVAFVVDFLGIKSRLSGGDEAVRAAAETTIEGPTRPAQPERSGVDLRAAERIEKEALALLLQKQAVIGERQALEQKLSAFQQEEERIKKERFELELRKRELDQREEAFLQQSKDLQNEKEQLVERAKKVEGLEKKLLEEQLIPRPQEDTVEERLARERELKKLAKGFSTMRPKDVANLLLEMLDKGDEGKGYVLRLLKNTDNDTRMRVMSAIAKNDVGKAAELTQTLIAR